MTTILNENPEKFYATGTFIQAQYDFEEKRIRERDKKGAEPLIRGLSETPYEIKKGDILVRFNDRDTVFASIDNLKLSKYTSSEEILNNVQFAGIAYTGLDPERKTNLPMLAKGVYRISYKGDHLRPGDRVRLDIPKYEKSKLGENYLSKFGKRRITFGIKREPKKIENSLQYLLHSSLKNISGTQIDLTQKSDFKTAWKISDISKFMSFSKWAVEMGLMRWGTDSPKDIHMDNGGKAATYKQTLKAENEFNAQYLGLLLGLTSEKYKDKTKSLWDTIYRNGKYGNDEIHFMKASGLKKVRDAPLKSLSILFEEFRKEKSKSFATVLSNTKSRGLELKIN